MRRRSRAGSGEVAGDGPQVARGDAVEEQVRFSPVLSGVDNRTLEANRALEAPAAEIGSDSGLAAPFASQDGEHLLATPPRQAAGRALLKRFAAFLESYGHRETDSPLLVSQPTWKDSPQTVLGMLNGMARVEPAPRTVVQPG